MRDYSEFRLLPLLPLHRDAGSAQTRVSEVTWEGGAFVHGPGSWEFGAYQRWLRGLIPRDLPWMMTDWSGRGPDFRAIKGSRVRGVDRWMDSGARSIDDVFDTLSLDVGRLLLSTLSIDSLEVLEEAQDVSDSCMPLLMCGEGAVLLRHGRMGLRDALGRMVDLGFGELVLMDLDRLGRGAGGGRLHEGLGGFDLRILPAGGISERDLPRLVAEGFDEAVRDLRAAPMRPAAERPVESPDPLLDARERLSARPSAVPL